MSAAGLDPAGGRICGYVSQGSARPGWIEVLLEGEPVGRLVAVLPKASLAPVPELAAAVPPGARCFALALPRRAVRHRALPATLGLQLTDGGEIFFSHRFDDAATLEIYTEGARMESRFSVEIVGLAGGTLEGTLLRHADGADWPALAVQLGGREVTSATLGESEGHRRPFSAPLPATLLSDGVQVLEIVAGKERAVLARYPLAAGDAASATLAAEVAMLRAELDELRRAAFAAASEPALPAADRPLIVAELAGHVEALLGAQDARVDAEIARLRALIAGGRTGG